MGSVDGAELMVGRRWNAGGGFQSLVNGIAEGFALGVSDGESEGYRDGLSGGCPGGDESTPKCAKMWSSPIRLKENKANPQLNPTQRVKRCQSRVPAVLLLVA